MTYNMFVGYWHKGGLEIYRTSEGAITMFASGAVDTLKPVKSFGKIVLIVGRDLLLHTRKKFPPASSDDLKKAVTLEIGEMFPIKSPSFSLTVFERTQSYTLADIWAWESSGYDNLKRVFPFTHVLPEDMAFISEEPEISVVAGTEGSLVVGPFNKWLPRSVFIQGPGQPGPHRDASQNDQQACRRV